MKKLAIIIAVAATLAGCQTPPPHPQPETGAFVGENAPSGVPAWDAAATKAGVPLRR